MRACSEIRDDGGRLLLLSPKDVVCLFDQEARELLRMSGRKAFERILKGRAGDNYVWADLRLLASLLPRKPKWPH